MSDIRLYGIKNGLATELPSSTTNLEKSLQTLMEQNLEAMLGIRFMATEYSTGRTHGGRIDSLGMDENNCPVIIEYKRTSSENVINQGLYYLDWLLDHKAEFEMLALKMFGQGVADNIDWSSPRLLCIASDFTKYDDHAVHQINRNIELIRYRKFGEELLLLELASSTSATAIRSTKSSNVTLSQTAIEAPIKKQNDKSYAECFDEMPAPLAEVHEAFEAFIFGLGDDVQKKELKLYAAYKRLKNFATEIIQKNALVICLHLNPKEQNDLPSIARDMTGVGHWGTGDLQVTIASLEELEVAKPFIAKAYLGKV